MNKSFLIFAGILAVFAAGLFAARALFAGGDSITGNAVNTIADSSGEVQEATLSYKDYNYYPRVIEVKKGTVLRITADSSIRGCYTSFLIPDLGVRHSFARSRTLEFVPQETGSFDFMCGMGMGTGKIVVSE